jgi:hypothetical protein
VKNTLHAVIVSIHGHLFKLENQVFQRVLMVWAFFLLCCSFLGITTKDNNSYLFNEFVCKLGFFGMSGPD